MNLHDTSEYLLWLGVSFLFIAWVFITVRLFTPLETAISLVGWIVVSVGFYLHMIVHRRNR